MWCKLDLKWFIWVINLRSWSCWLWYKHPLWVLTLLTKQDTGFYLINIKIGSTHFISHLWSSPIFLSPSPVSFLLNAIVFVPTLFISLIWRDCLSEKLVSWSCQLWCQYASLVLTLLTKQDNATWSIWNATMMGRDDSVWNAKMLGWNESIWNAREVGLGVWVKAYWMQSWWGRLRRH